MTRRPARMPAGKWRLLIRGYGYLWVTLHDGRVFKFGLKLRFAWLVWILAEAQQRDAAPTRTREGWRTKQEISTSMYKANGYELGRGDSVRSYVSSTTSIMREQLATQAPDLEFISIFETKSLKGVRIAEGIDIELVDSDDEPDDGEDQRLAPALSSTVSSTNAQQLRVQQSSSRPDQNTPGVDRVAESRIPLPSKPR